MVRRRLPPCGIAALFEDFDMDIELSPADEAFRAEIREFLDGSLTEALRDGARKRTSLWQDMGSAMTWQRILHAKGWAAPDWPYRRWGSVRSRSAATGGSSMPSRTSCPTSWRCVS